MSQEETPPMEAADKSDPAYSDGYWAMLHGKDFDLERTLDVQYCFGWRAAKRAVEILSQNGFARTGANFSKTTVVSPSSPINRSSE